MQRAEGALIRYRLALATALAALALGFATRQAGAAAEVHKLNLVLSAIPSSVSGGDFNAVLDTLNFDIRNDGRESVDPITYAWLFQAELRYLVRPNLAIVAGVGQLKNQTEREYLPALQEDIRLRAEVLSVPIHVGASYYFQPYSAGDFQARAYAGGGFLSLVDNRVKFQRAVDSASPPPSLASWPDIAFKGDSPGFYLEAGVHMFFALRYSVLLGGLYRDARISHMRNRATHEPVYAPDGKPFELDV